MLSRNFFCSAFIVYQDVAALKHADLYYLMEDERPAPGRRLIQLALNDAVQSRLCLNSPIKAQMEKEKRERRKNKITIWTESNGQNSTLAPNVLVCESVNGFRSNTSDAKWGCSWVPNSKNQSPSLRHEFRDKYRNDSYNQCVNSNYKSLNSSKFGSRDVLFSTAPSQTSNMLTFAASDCNRRDVKSNAAGFERDNVRTFSSQTLVNSQLICDHTDENIPAKHFKAGVSLNSSYDLPILSKSYESRHSNLFPSSGMSGTPGEKDMSEIPNISSELFKHLTLHSLENSSRDSKEEHSSDFIPPPIVGSHLLKDQERNNLSSSIEIPAPVDILASSQVEIPAPLDTADQINSLKFDSIIAAEEQLARFSENTYNNERTVNSNINSLKNSSTIKKHSNPNFLTFKHFEGLIYDKEKKQSSFITVITDDLELEIVSNPSQWDSYDVECPISKPVGLNADLLVDSFLNLDYKIEHDETLSGRKAFDDMLYVYNADNTVHPQVKKNSTPLLESNPEKNIPGKSNTRFHSGCLSEHFPNYGARFSDTNPNISMSNPYSKDYLNNYDEERYFASKECSPLSHSVTSQPGLQFETANPNCSSTSESKFLNSFNGNCDLFNSDDAKDQMSSSKTDNLPQNHFCSSSKLGKSVDVLNLFNVEDGSRQCSDSHEDSVSHYGGEALKCRSLNKASGSLDSGIGLVSDELECDSVWNLL